MEIRLGRGHTTKTQKNSKSWVFSCFMTDSPSVPLTRSNSTNQTPLRRSRRNHRNHTNRGQCVTKFENKTSYKFKKLLVMWVDDFWKSSSQLLDRRRASGDQGNQASKEGRNSRTENQNYMVSPQDNQFVGSRHVHGQLTVRTTQCQKDHRISADNLCQVYKIQCDKIFCVLEGND